MKISEYQTSRHAEAVRRREERERAAYEAYKAAAELAGAHAELEQLLADARASLTPTPTQGAPWDAETRYIAGDTVEGGYVALRYSRGKNPTDHLGTYWAVQTVTYPAWGDIEDGTVIYEGGIVSYGGKNWICTEQHIKSTVYKPKAGSSRWSEYTE